MALRRVLHLLRRRPAAPAIAPPTAGCEDLAPRCRTLQQDLDHLQTALLHRDRTRIPAALRGPAEDQLPPLDPGVTLQGLVDLLEHEHAYFRTVLARLAPGLSWAEAGARLRPPCQQVFQLSGFYLAHADWALGRITFPYFYEAGRPNPPDPLPLDPGSGLTGWALFEPGPCYLPDPEACLARGMRWTEAERRTGLHTRSWFGAPLPSADPFRPRGLMGFHCYHPRAFSADQQRWMATTAALAALHLA